MTETLQRYDVDTLWVDSVGIRPVSIDWQEAWREGEGWNSFEAPDCPECGDYARWDRDEYEWRCRNAECENRAAIDLEDDGPKMNYYYPLPDLNRIGDDEYAAAEAISDLPLCVVQFDDGSWALALTGGGMDLSWEIAEAFTRLGYLPPLHYCDLPRMSGYPRTEGHHYTIAACKRSADVAIYQAQRTRAELDAFDEKGKEVSV